MRLKRKLKLRNNNLISPHSPTPAKFFLHTELSPSVKSSSFARYDKIYKLISNDIIMQSQTKDKKSYSETNEIARSPTLQTVLMVEKFIDDNSGAYKKTELFNKLPKKVMWQTFQVIMEYLENSLRIVYDKEGYVVYIWNPKFYEKIKNRPQIKI